MNKRMVSIAGALVLAACGTTQMAGPALQDGQVPLPDGYKSWPVYLSGVQRPDAKQVRDIWINPTGHAAKRGGPFANGSVLVMENWAVKLNADGTPMTGADGKLVKDKLAAVFVMAKGPGYGSTAKEGLKTGDWAYAAYDPAGKLNATAPHDACRACHVPLASNDFVARTEEYFTKRGN